MVTAALDEAAAAEQPMEDIGTKEVIKPSVPQNDDDEASAQEKVKELKALILKQAEYYFSDANLPTHLKLLRKLHVNNGWLNIKSLCKFEKMNSLSKDETFVATTLKASKELLELSSDGTKVRRRGYPASLNALRIDGAQPVQRSIYVKGFPKDLEDIEQTVKSSFETFGTITTVKPRTEKGDEPTFKGSVYVEFADVESARRARFNSEGLKYQDETLIIYSKEEYMNLKFKERMEQYQAKPWNVYYAYLCPPPVQIPLPPRPTKALLQFSFKDIQTGDGLPGVPFLNGVREFFSKPATTRWIAKPIGNVGFVLYSQPGDAEKALEHFGAHMQKPNGLFKGETTLRLPTEQEEETFWQSYESSLRGQISERTQHRNGCDRNNNGMRRDWKGGLNKRDFGNGRKGNRNNNNSQQPPKVSSAKPPQSRPNSVHADMKDKKKNDEKGNRTTQVAGQESATRTSTAEEDISDIKSSSHAETVIATDDVAIRGTKRELEHDESGGNLRKKEKCDKSGTSQDTSAAISAEE
ncbi:hypothetical protein SeMB42_g03815 [Synchytrium endobioticum]|uniref:HTH La-type RNA-binding domain-containing protein n=1 Tax=Synchytrium endobioticum TaxID=286115 RepID=A0A507DDD7_9FUNG|nr:hypothetical protein SeMB42_g03815 [Synchytrium endobioticum]TPX49421.1 hypothetical protein SeLEV6574_g01481 [Synchytrium endobioticum]